MAPKGSKRAATLAAGRKSKAPKMTLQDTQLREVEEALGAATCVPEGCRDMLLAVLSSSLGAPREERHAVQDQVIAMIGEALEKARAGKEEAADKATAEAAAPEARRAELQSKQQNAEGQLQSKAQAADEKKEALEAARAKSTEGRAALEVKQQAEQAAKVAAEAARQELSSFDAAIAEHFAPLKEGAWGEEAEAAHRHLEALEPAVHKAALDESAHASLRISGCKAAAQRSDFDGVVLEQVGAALTQWSEKLKAELEQRDPAVTECAAAVAGQAAENDAVQSEIKALEAAHEAAVKEHEECEAAAKAAQAETRAFMAEAKKVFKDRDALLAERDLFVQGPVAAFEALREGPPTKAVEAAASEEPAAPVTVGGA